MATKFQRFEVRQVRRGVIKNADYNPRVISGEARKRLKRKIRKAGLVEPLIWNETTGNLVGGHQRLSILDELEGRSDYELTVSVVRLDAAAEKKLNVFLNNASAMGEWDEERLADIVKEFEDAPEDLGFDLADLNVVFEDGELGGLFDDRNETATADIEKIREMKEIRKKHRRQSDETESGDHYAVLVFSSERKRDGFLKRCGFEKGQRFVNGEEMMRLLKGVLKHAEE